LPIREYKCIECGEVQERIELDRRARMNPLCKKCGGRTEKYLSNKVNFNLSGDGWYSGGFNGGNNNE